MSELKPVPGFAFPPASVIEAIEAHRRAAPPTTGEAARDPNASPNAIVERLRADDEARGAAVGATLDGLIDAIRERKYGGTGLFQWLPLLESLRSSPVADPALREAAALYLEHGRHAAICSIHSLFTEDQRCDCGLDALRTALSRVPSSVAATPKQEQDQG